METKKNPECAICTTRIRKVRMLTCSNCGRSVCPKCYVDSLRWCAECTEEYNNKLEGAGA